MTLNEAKLFEMLGRSTAEATLLREELAKAQMRIQELEEQGQAAPAEPGEQTQH